MCQINAKDASIHMQMVHTDCKVQWKVCNAMDIEFQHKISKKDYHALLYFKAMEEWVAFDKQE